MNATTVEFRRSSGGGGGGSGDGGGGAQAGGGVHARFFRPNIFFCFRQRSREWKTQLDFFTV